jgi:high-affinity iron transporter
VGVSECLRFVGVCGVVCTLTFAVACGAAPSPSIEQGRSLYSTNGCVTCHGPAGHGDGPIAKTLVPAPRDFRDAAAFKNGTEEAAIARTLADGLAAKGGGMPRFDHLTEYERRSIALFVRSLHQPSTERSGLP